LVYASIIFYISSLPNPPAPELFPNADKLIHLIEYGILTFLLTRAIGNMKLYKNKTEAIYIAIIITGIYGLTDEIHQAYVFGRECSFIDWVFDLSGGFAYLLLLFRHYKWYKT